MTTIWDQAAEPERTTELSEQECWDFLRGCSFGRLAYRTADEVNIVPINAVVDGDRVLFRTAEGSKLLGMHMSERVAFEADQVNDEVATSVVAKGPARELRTGVEQARAEAVLPPPWTAGWKGTFVAIQVEEITGRHFQLRR